MDEVRSLLTRVALDLAGLAADERSNALAHRMLTTVADAPALETNGSSLPVIDSIRRDGPPLRDMLLALSPAVPWESSPRVSDEGAGVGLLDFSSCLDLGELTVGAMAVGPNNFYPEHQHAPFELYLVLGGSARWRFGGAEHYVDVEAGQMVVNPPNVVHGVRTADDAVLAVYVLDT